MAILLVGVLSSGFALGYIMGLLFPPQARPVSAPQSSAQIPTSEPAAPSEPDTPVISNPLSTPNTTRKTDNGTEGEKSDMNEKPLVEAGPNFKVVGYYPAWSTSERDRLRYDVLTHVIYAFAIPQSDGTLRPLQEPDNARTILKQAHENGVKVLVAVGGWSYNDNPLETVFKSATATPELTAKLVGELCSLVDTYGFDGIDVDWEHPRYQDVTQTQYAQFIKLLREEMDKRQLLLTAAVLSGVSADGNVVYDAAAHTDEVLQMVDWINVMAYDGGDGERHSSNEFAKNCGEYWTKTRGLAKEKVMLGVPFYGRPSWAAYDQIVETHPDKYREDIATINGMEAHYNGVDTIERKTAYAIENLGGVMIWEVSQDCLDDQKSLLAAIGRTIG